MNQPHQLAGKRILFALCGFDLGGAERQALYLARHLKDLGCDVRVWGHHHRYAGPERVIGRCESMGIPWSVQKFRWPCGKRALLRDSWRMMRALRRERPDVILSYTGWPNVGCGLTWRLSPAKVFIWGQRDVERLGSDAVTRFAYRQASAVICNAEHEIGYLYRTFGDSRAPISVVHNGVNLAPRQKDRVQWRKDLGIEEDETVAAMVANFRPGKEHSTLLRAWRYVISTVPEGQARPRLVLAGAHQESFNSVQELATNLGLLESVVFPGHVTDVAGLLSASDIGVLTTTDEGLPNAIIEYMVSGMPVVATDVPGNREVLGDDPRQTYCKPNDSDSLANHLRALLSDPELRQDLGARNQRRAAEEFSIDRMCRSMVGVIVASLDSVLEQTVRPTRPMSTVGIRE